MAWSNLLGDLWIVQVNPASPPAWLSALPVEEYGFCLSKGSFRDAISLRYGWQPPSMHSKCACGMSLSVDHAMIDVP